MRTPKIQSINCLINFFNTLPDSDRSRAIVYKTLTKRTPDSVLQDLLRHAKPGAKEPYRSALDHFGLTWY